MNYAGFPALKDVSLRGGRGELLALTGPNGSGKSTLLRAALGLVEPSAGEVRLLGSISSRMRISERALRVAWVPQLEAPQDDVSVFDYVLYGRNPHVPFLAGESRQDREIVRRILKDLDLWARKDSGILQLSGGERQRVLFARAAAQDTPVLLLDEPTASLDIGHQLDLLDRVRAHARSSGQCVVAALHDLNLAARYADRVAVLSRGRLVADGPPTRVLSEQLLRDVWGVIADLRKDPLSGLPYLVPRLATTPRASAAVAERPVIHIVPGGGAAVPVVRMLVDDGFPITMGVVALLDSDYEVARELGVAVAAEVPFSPFSETVRQDNQTLLLAADGIVVAPFPVGPHNLVNLEDLAPVAATIPLAVMLPDELVQRDFTGGRAVAVFQSLKEAGATECRSLADVRAWVARLPRREKGLASRPSSNA